MYYENLIAQALGNNFKDIPFNQCISNASLIEISFTPPRRMVTTWDDPDFMDICSMIAEACRAISISSMGKWDFYHPQLIYKPPQSGKTGVVIAKFFGKPKEEEPTKPSDTEIDP